MADYRAHVTVRQRGKPPVEGLELRSEDFDDDESFCLALASWLMDQLNGLRDDEDNEDADTY